MAHLWTRYHHGKIWRAGVLALDDDPRPAFISFGQDFRIAGRLYSQHLQPADGWHDSLEAAQQHADDALGELHTCDATCGGWERQA